MRLDHIELMAAAAGLDNSGLREAAAGLDHSGLRAADAGLDHSWTFIRESDEGMLQQCVSECGVRRWLQSRWSILSNPPRFTDGIGWLP